MMDITKLKGMILTDIQINDVKSEITFTNSEHEQYVMYHMPDCCESVTVEEIFGDLKDLIGSPILDASEETSHQNPEGVQMEYQDSFTWTFYKLATIKGSVTIRWYGESNGYYSESVTFDRKDIRDERGY